MLAYDFNTTAYTRDPLDHFSLLKDMPRNLLPGQVGFTTGTLVMLKGYRMYPLGDKIGPRQTNRRRQRSKADFL